MQLLHKQRQVSLYETREAGLRKVQLIGEERLFRAIKLICNMVICNLKVLIIERENFFL